MTFRPTKLYCKVPTLDIADVVEAVAKPGNIRTKLGRRRTAEIPDRRHRRFLRASEERNGDETES